MDMAVSQGYSLVGQSFLIYFALYYIKAWDREDR